MVSTKGASKGSTGDMSKIQGYDEVILLVSFDSLMLRLAMLDRKSVV